MAYRVAISPAAARQLRKLEKPAQRRIAQQIDALAVNPRMNGVEKMAGADLYRVRAGRQFRIIFNIQDALLTVLIVKIGDRKDIYRRQ